MAPVIRRSSARRAWSAGRRGHRPAPRDARPGQRAVRHPPDQDLDIIAPRQTLDQITDRALAGLSEVLRPSSGRTRWWCRATPPRRSPPALAAFYAEDPGGPRRGGAAHGRPLLPVPGGDQPPADLAARRRCTWRRPPTSRANLLAENVDPADIVVTGNTVIDALLDVVARDLPLRDPALAALSADGPVVLVTAHRRESWGEPMARDRPRARAARRGVPGRRVRAAGAPQPGRARSAAAAARRRCPTWSITEPLPYADFCRADAAQHRHPHRQRRGAGGGAEPRQAGAGHARHHRAARGGAGRHGTARRHR